MGNVWRLIAGIEFAVLIGAMIGFFLWKKASTAEGEAQQVSNILDLIMQTIRSILIVLDEEDRIIMCSSSFAEQVGAKSKESLQGLRLEDIKRTYSRKEINNDVYQELKKNGYVSKIYEFPREKNKSVWIDIKAKKIMQGDRFFGNMILCTDITKEMQGKEEMLSLMNLRERILMSISHELKTPLNAIAGSVDILSLSKALGEKERSHVVNIKEAYRTLSRRVNEITEYSNIKNEELTLENQEFVLQDIFDVVRNAVYIRTYEKGINFIISVCPEIPEKLYGDVEKISKVILHLLLNRVENTEEGHIELSIQPLFREDKLFLRYEIKDTGKCMAEEEIKQFVEGDEYDELERDGGDMIAIGFAIAREYIRAMGGKLQAGSTYNKENSFCFELETKVMSEKQAAQVRNPEEKSVLLCFGANWKINHSREMIKALEVPKVGEYKDQTSITNSVWSHIFIDSQFPEASEVLRTPLSYPCKKVLILEASGMVVDGLLEADIIVYEPFHVLMLADVLNQSENREKRSAENDLLFKTKGIRALIVDDNEVNLMVCTDILHQYGIETDEADSGMMAVQKYCANDYDLIVMDYLMPGIDGVETTRRIRDIQKTSPEPVIIALSANVTMDIHRQFEDAGAQEVMTKPLELKELSRVLRKWLSKEQIIENAEEKKEREGLFSDEALRSVLRDVNGLDIEKGLSHVLNSTESYIKVLKICIGNVTEQIEHIKAGCTIVAPMDLKINFHSLKGIFANVGADGLAEKSKLMEIAAEKNDDYYIQENVVEYIESVMTFVQELTMAIKLYQEIVNATSETEEASELMPDEEYREAIRLAKEAVHQYDFTEITRILEVLQKGSRGKRRNIFEKALDEIGEFHYETVMELLERASEEEE